MHALSSLPDCNFTICVVFGEILFNIDCNEVSDRESC